jgi:hypothetical protein
MYYLDTKVDYRSSLSLFNYASDFKVFFEWLQSERISNIVYVKDVETSTLEKLTLKEAEAFFKPPARKTYIISKKTNEKRKSDPILRQ